MVQGGSGVAAIIVDGTRFAWPMQRPDVSFLSLASVWHVLGVRRMASILGDENAIAALKYSP